MKSISFSANDEHYLVPLGKFDFLGEEVNASMKDQIGALAEMKRNNYSLFMLSWHTKSL